MKFLFRLLPVFLCLTFAGCSSDEPDGPEPPETTDYPDCTVSDNNSTVVINDDNTTSTGVSFRPLDDYDFVLDGLIYSIGYGTMTITGSEPSSVSGDVKPYSSVVYKGNSYSVTAVGAKAFRNCTEMKSCSLPQSVVKIESGNELGAFSGCTKLRAVFFPKGIKDIGDESFRNCASLAMAYIPDGTERIGYDAFYGCESLKAVNLPASLKNVNRGAFAACKSLISVKLPEEAWFDDGVFADCTSLKTVEIPEGWLILPGSMFAGCVSLESPKLPAGMMNIGLNAFAGCTAIESIDLPSDLQMIWTGTFAGCTSLKTVKVNGRCNGLWDNAFAGCSSLRTFTCTSTQPPFLKANVFSGIPSDATLYVPAASVDVYKSSSWGDYFKNIVPLN